MSDFKLIKELGLEVHEHDYVEYIDPAELESLLAKGVRVELCKRENAIPEYQVSLSFHTNKTHTGLLIGITPIQKDTAESLLREFERVFAKSWVAGKRSTIVINDNAKAWDLCERAKKLLEGK